jgi:plasmid replication initiation protein
MGSPHLLLIKSKWGVKKSSVDILLFSSIIRAIFIYSYFDMPEILKVVKDNILIENFIFNATEQELQILNYAVALTNPKWENKGAIYTIPIPDLVSVFRTKSNSAWQQYRKALSRLQYRTYSYFDNNGEKHTENLITRVSENPKDKTYLRFKFNDYISDRLSNLQKLFTQYDIKNIAQFSSRYSFMLYEFFKMKIEQSQSAYTQTIALENFKENLDISGKYKQLRDLKNNVLEKSKKQINKHSDIHINYEIIKTGRTPTHIKFTAKYKKGKSPTELLDSQKAQPKIENLKNNISDIIKHQTLSEDQLKSRKEKWKSVKAELKI